MNPSCLHLLLIFLGLVLAISCQDDVELPANSTAEQGRCPTRCLCFRTTVRCMFLQLDRIPSIPPETTILDLRFNRIVNIPPHTFQALSNLNTLLLNNNQITKLQNGVFSGLRELRYLYLYKNRIGEIENKVFQDVPRLEQLYLHFNNLETFHEEVFSALSGLERLFLQNNKLTRIPKETFKNLDNLNRLRLDSNALVCDCQMLWLARMLNEKHGTQAAATCKYPETVHGKSLMALEDNEFNCKKPSLTQEPTDVEVTFGGTVYFSCKAEGDPEPNIVWLKNSNEISTTDDPRYQLLGDGTLMIENPSDLDMGSNYECVAKNAAGEVKSRQVKVKSPSSAKSKPRFIETPSDVDALIEGMAQFVCNVTGNPRPELTWSFNEAPLLSTRIEIADDGTLILKGLERGDAGSYRCKASNNLGRITAAAQLRVLAAPIITEKLQDHQIFEHEPVELRCSAEGFPFPVLKWLRDGDPMVFSSRVLVFGGGRTLRISSTLESDSARYICVATNALGTAESVATLTVLPRESRKPPVITKGPKSTEARLRNSLKLSCHAAGLPSPTLRWTKNGFSLPESERITIRGDTLAIDKVEFDDGGLYECTAVNDLGIDVAKAVVTIKGLQEHVELAQLFCLDDEIETRIPTNFIVSAVNEAKRNVDQATDDTVAQLFASTRGRNHRFTHSELLRLTRFPNAVARETARASEVYERAMAIVRKHVEAGNVYNVSDFSYEEVLTAPQLQLIANLSGCTAHRHVPDCSDMCFHSKYRTFDGTCNNLQQPTWGASYTAFKRLLPAIYENGLNLPVGWSKTAKYFGFSKPSARLVSTRLISTDTVTSDDTFTHMLMQWGQYLDHDLDLAVPGMAMATFGERIDCRQSCEFSNPCFPIEVPPNDPRVRHLRCMEFTRNSAVCGSGTTSVLANSILPREQINQLTAYIDASQIYGSTETDARELRDFRTKLGKLREGISGQNGKPFLPFSTQDTPVDCKRNRSESPIECFLAGDIRANEQIGLLTLHTVWFREHNRIAGELARINSDWNTETIYHETRKIVGALHQHITYTHWLPRILGLKGIEMMAPYQSYDPQVDVSISNVFATAAMRMGHGMIQPVLTRLNSSFKPIEQGHLLLQNAFFSSWRLVDEGGVDPILRGLFATPAKIKTADQILNSDLTETLARPAHLVAQDLAALNIQRARDHALPSYNDWRKHCKLSLAHTFDDLRHEIKSKDLRDKLEQVYGHPGNIDPWVGGIAEDLVDGAKVGPTFRCLLVDQFRRLRDGDRFWYENPGVFKPEQLTQIKQATLSRVICDNGDNIEDVTKDVFLLPQQQNPPFRECKKIPRVDLRFWKECENCGHRGHANINDLPSVRQKRYVEKHLGALNVTKEGNPDKTPTQHQAKKSNDVESEFHTPDDRVTGLEATLSQLQRTVKHLTRKIKKLEAGCSKSKSPSQPGLLEEDHEE